MRIGLASKCFPDDQLMEGAMELATRIAKGPTVAHSLTKYLVQESMDLSFREALEAGLRGAGARPKDRGPQDCQSSGSWTKIAVCRRLWAAEIAIAPNGRSETLDGKGDWLYTPFPPTERKPFFYGCGSATDGSVGEATERLEHVKN